VPSLPAPQTDGRALRSERSREALVSALVELVGEGKLVPTAQQVAERAGVGIRTVFRHFKDMESLFSAMADALRADFESLLAAAPVGSFEERAVRLARQRAEAYEFIAPYERSTRVQLWRSEFLRQEHSRWARKLRAGFQTAFPEIAEASSTGADIADALEMALSFSSWDRLRSEQKLSARRSAEAMELAVRAIVQLSERR